MNILEKLSVRRSTDWDSTMDPSLHSVPWSDRQ